METFLRSNQAVRLMLLADVLAVLGWFIVKLNGGTDLLSRSSTSQAWSCGTSCSSGPGAG
ncbi:MAG: hypothetical protein FJ410_02445 [Verrucomicrobia bacterium]|nr:hypothetical protein [Verrucomicrobiota bacterium]